MKKALIIGAGPAGLTAAYELLKKGKDVQVVVFEESDCFGGISRTVAYGYGRSSLLFQDSGSECVVGSDASYAGSAKL